jgi:hypothetical protein
MGVACGTYGGEETYIRSFRKGKPKERDHLGDIVIDVKIK